MAEGLVRELADEYTLNIDLGIKAPYKDSSGNVFELKRGEQLLFLSGADNVMLNAGNGGVACYEKTSDFSYICPDDNVPLRVLKYDIYNWKNSKDKREEIVREISGL